LIHGIVTQKEGIFRLLLQEEELGRRPRADGLLRDQTFHKPCISKAVAAWQKQNPMLAVRAILPIVGNGNTIAHVWFN